MNNKQIGAQILREYQAGTHGRDDRDRAVFQVDGLTVRCKCNFDAVYAVAEKFRKRTTIKVTQPVPNKPRPVTRRFSITAFRDFAQDGERDNAVEYAKNYGLVNLPIEAQALVRSWA